MSNSYYTPLQEITTENNNNSNTAVNTTTNNNATPQPSATEVCMMRRSARWVVFLSFVQLFGAIFALLNGGLLIMIISAIFISMGIVGACKKRPRLLIAHFVYSLALYVLTLVGIIAMIIYCMHCSFVVFLLGFFFLIIQAVGMRHSRILIGYARLYPNTGCAWKCASRCNWNQRQACGRTQQPQQQVQVAEERQPQPVQQLPVQQPIQSVPQFYPQMIAIPPQQYMQMQMQQGMPMMPMGMQPYIAFPQPPQNPSANAPQQQALYPSVPVVYRQV